MKQLNTSYDGFAHIYDKVMSNNGDFFHQNTCDPALFKVIGKYKGKKVYDLGCGNGYLSRRLVNGGVKEMWASDISQRMINIAQTKYANPKGKIKYLVLSATNFRNIPKDYFDLVFMNMVIHYVEDLPKLFLGIRLILKPKGRFAFTTYNPTYPLAKRDLKDNALKNAKLINEVKKYFTVTKDKKENRWAENQDLDFFYRPISYYVNTLVKHGFLIDSLLEPRTVRLKPSGKKIFSFIPGMIALGAQKK